MRAVAVAAGVLVFTLAAAEGRGAPTRSCSGDYADDLAALSARARERERDPANPSSYCLRTMATYECLSYASDGSVKRTRITTVAHGTGFAYRRERGETYLLTNDHVAEWPAVTSDEHPVEGVPSGCKRVAETVRVVDGEDDAYEANDITLQAVVSDPALDAAVLKTRAPLRLVPYRLGKSASLRVGNVVSVRGFPLGAFAATNVGKVVNAYDHDVDRDWDHADFVVDALLSPGNSGSPVLAVSCKTGEYELVGVYHAGYTRGSALNVVVAIDQLRDLMVGLKRTQRVADSGDRFGPDDRALVEKVMGGAASSPWFAVGPLVAAARPGAGGALWLELYSRGFPLDDQRLLVVEELPSREGFGDVGRVYAGNRRGVRLLDRAQLDGDAQAQLARVVGRLVEQAVVTARWRSADPATRKGARQRQALERAQQRRTDGMRDDAQTAADLSERYAPRTGEKATPLADALGPAGPVESPVQAALPTRWP